MKEKCGKSWLKRLWGWVTGPGGGGCAGCGGCAGKCRCAVGEEVTLDALGIGQTGEVVEVAGGDQDMVNRFADHGLVRGIKVSVPNSRQWSNLTRVRGIDFHDFIQIGLLR